MQCCKKDEGYQPAEIKNGAALLSEELFFGQQGRSNFMQRFGHAALSSVSCANPGGMAEALKFYALSFFGLNTSNMERELFRKVSIITSSSISSEDAPWPAIRFFMTGMNENHSSVL